jgi:hypothetical protein
LKLRIYATLYDYRAAMDEGSLGLWRDLKRETGWGRQTLQQALVRFDELPSAAAIFDDDELLDAIIALTWLCRHHNGEQVTFADAAKVRFEDIEFVLDPQDMATGSEPDDESDPTARPNPDAAGASNGSSSPATHASLNSSRTSPVPSGSTS